VSLTQATVAPKYAESVLRLRRTVEAGSCRKEPSGFRPKNTSLL